MCFCCVGWGLFLWNYWTTGSFQVCADRAAVEKNAKLLGAQGVAATLDFFVWTSLFELQGASLVAVVMIFDVIPLILQLCFTAYLFVRLSSSPACRTSAPASCFPPGGRWGLPCPHSTSPLAEGLGFRV